MQIYNRAYNPADAASIFRFSGGLLQKPFVKWTGGKSPLLGEIDRRLPFAVVEGKSLDYVEPFVPMSQTYKKAITSKFAEAGTPRSNVAKV